MSVSAHVHAPTAILFVATALVGVVPLAAQEPVDWGDELVFHTFSIAGVDPATGESGVAVTTRNACVGNGVPWVRVGVGAVATQASTRTAYGSELLDMLEAGMSPQDALDAATAADEGRDNRQVGVLRRREGRSVHGQRSRRLGGPPIGPELRGAGQRTGRGG